MLTRPLLLYYAALNLTRGLMLPFLGRMGPEHHGLRFVEGESLLDCGAKVAKGGGTFGEFARSLNADSEVTCSGLISSDSAIGGKST
jgi:hypothetical protein